MRKVFVSFLALLWVLAFASFASAQEEEVVECEMEYDPAISEEAGADCFPPDSDGVGTYGIARVGGHYFWYCNKDQTIKVTQRIHIAQWMAVYGWGLDRDVYLRKPGRYTYCGDEGDIVLGVQSNGRVGISFDSDIGFDAPWSGPDGTEPYESVPLPNQIPVDKKYMVLVNTTAVDGGQFGVWVERPQDFDLLNSQELHGPPMCISPQVYIRIKEMLKVYTCNTAGQYDGWFRIYVKALNQKLWIVRATGGWNLAAL